jgi:hypothetical protein
MDWERFRDQVNADPVLATQGAGSSFRLLLGWGDDQCQVTVHDAIVTSVKTGPFVMPQCDFALTGSADAWARFSLARPAPREQDIFAFFRSGEILLTGDTRKFYAHLMCLKLILGHLRTLT